MFRVKTAEYTGAEYKRRPWGLAAVVPGTETDPQRVNSIRISGGIYPETDPLPLVYQLMPNTHVVSSLITKALNSATVLSDSYIPSWLAGH